MVTEASSVSNASDSAFVSPLNTPLSVNRSRHNSASNLLVNRVRHSSGASITVRHMPYSTQPLNHGPEGHLIHGHASRSRHSSAGSPSSLPRSAPLSPLVQSFSHQVRKLKKYWPFLSMTSCFVCSKRILCLAVSAFARIRASVTCRPEWCLVSAASLPSADCFELRPRSIAPLRRGATIRWPRKSKVFWTRHPAESTLRWIRFSIGPSRCRCRRCCNSSCVLVSVLFASTFAHQHVQRPEFREFFLLKNGGSPLVLGHIVRYQHEMGTIAVPQDVTLSPKPL